MKNEICIIIPYFGKLPVWIDLFIHSCQMNSEIDFLFFTDEDSMSEFCGANIKVVGMSFGKMQNLIHSKLGGVLPSPYKLCDYRPCYGHVFSEYLEDYAYWGHCDVDMIFGRIMEFLNIIDYSQYDRVFQWGHFSLYKNNSDVNELYSRNISGVPPVVDFNFVRKTSHACYFDELGVVYKFRKLGYRVYDKCLMADINIICDNFAPSRADYQKEWLFVYQDKSVYGLYVEDGKMHKKEYLYVHFQKRKLPLNRPVRDRFVIDENGFSEYSREFIINKLTRRREITKYPVPLGYKKPYLRYLEAFRRDFELRGLMAFDTICRLLVSRMYLHKVSECVYVFDEGDLQVEIEDI